MPPKSKRVGIYVRVSSDVQSTDMQRHELSAWAERAGHSVVKVYEDQGISGAKGRDKRPAFDALLKDAVRREIDFDQTQCNEPLDQARWLYIGTTLAERGESLTPGHHGVTGRDLPVLPGRRLKVDGSNRTPDLVAGERALHAATRRIGYRDRGKQPLRIGMLRIAKDRLARADLDEFAEIHDGDSVTDPLDDRHVVADEQVGQPHTGLQVEHQIDHLRLHRNVESRDRLVGND